ncbi:MAG: LuxR C-terminal-related transcriptional regulator [Thermoanaerobaculia bacterium]
MFREVLSALLADSPGLQVAGSASALEALDVVGLFDVVLVDAGKDTRRALSRLRALRDRWGDVKMVVLGLPREDESVADFIEAGARGYVLRGDSPEVLVSAIREVQEGRSPCAPPVVTAVLRRITALAEAPPAAAPPTVEPLTRREREILALLAEGYSNKELCHRLHITVQTAKNHVHNILTKLQVHRRRDAVRLALELDLLKVSGEEGASPNEERKE